MENLVTNWQKSPGRCGSVCGVSSQARKDCWFHSQSGHVLRLQVWSPVGLCVGGSVWCFSFTSVLLSLLLSLLSSLSLLLSLKNKNKLAKDLKRHFAKGRYTSEQWAHKNTHHSSSEKWKLEPQGNNIAHPLERLNFKGLTAQTAGEDVEQTGPSHAAGGNVRWCGHYGKDLAVSYS